MQSSAVVKGQVALEHGADVLIPLVSDAVIDLGLHRMEEGLDEGVVGHLARAVHALADA